MSTYEIKITNFALEQMQEILTYISATLNAPDAARNLLKSIQTEMEKCSELPARHPLLMQKPWHSRGIRRLIVKNFFAYYWIDEAHLQVWFIAVVYSKRNQAAELLKAIMQ